MTTFKTAHMDSKLHEQITKDARRNKISFSEQIKEYRDNYIVKEGVEKNKVVG